MISNVPFSLIARLISSLLLFWALAPHTYSYFTLLRWAVSFTGLYSATIAYAKKETPWIWTFGIIGLFFNPFFPVHLDRGTWKIIDSLTGIILLLSIFFIRENKVKIEKNIVNSQKGIPMSRRYSGHMSGEQFLANTSPSKLEVHDLDNEKTSCQIDEIIKAGHDKPYDSLEAAHKAGFDNCAWCIGGSRR